MHSIVSLPKGLAVPCSRQKGQWFRKHKNAHKCRDHRFHHSKNPSLAGFDAAQVQRIGKKRYDGRLQQGDRNPEAIAYFEQALSGLNEEDHLTASALDDRLVRLYTRTGEYQKALDAHDDYVYHNQKYLIQRQDEVQQEMDSRFEVQKKERELERRGYQITILLLLLLISAAIAVFLIFHARAVRHLHSSTLTAK